MEKIDLDNSRTHTTCPYCGVGCGVDVLGGGVGVEGTGEHPANRGRLCVKGAALHETLGLENRLLYPEIRGQRTDWDSALDEITTRLQAVIREHGPDAVACYGSGQLLTEDYYAANKLMKGFVGTSHMDTNSRLCMASPVAAYKRAFGSDAVPGCYEDLDQADLLVLTGSNAAWTHPVLFQRMAAAKRRRPGMKVVVIDPRRTATCDLADLHLPIRPGADAFLFSGLLAWLADHNGLDAGYIKNHTRDFEQTLQSARAHYASLDQAARLCGVDSGELERFFRWFRECPRTVTFYSQGINQSATGTDKCNAIINCHLATGRVGKPGASPFSITGQPNAMGGREVGGLANQLAAHMNFVPGDIDRVARFWNTPRLAQQPGLKAVDLFQAVASGRIRFLWILSTNPLVSLPDAGAMGEALRRCPTVVVSDCMADTETVRAADIRLPACTWGEKNGTVTNSERCISRQRPFLTPPGEARPDWWALAQVGRRLGYAASFDWRHPADIFAEHAALSGFENDGGRVFDISALSGLNRQTYDDLMPVQWPVNNNHPDGCPRVFGDGRFATEDRRARFVPVTPALPDHPDEAGELVMNTGRLRDQWHTMTRTGKARRLLQHVSEPFAAMHPVDARRRHIGDNDLVRVINARGELLLRARLTGEQRPGEVFVPMHWSRPFSSQARVGTLIGPVTDPHSGQPESKYARVTLQRCDTRWQGFLLTRQPRRDPDCLYWSYTPLPGGHAFELAGDDDPSQARTRLQALLTRPRESASPDWLQLEDPTTEHFRDAVIENDHLAGVLFIHPRGSLPDREWLIGLMRGERLTPEERRALLSGCAPDGAADNGAVVCACFQVGEKQIRRRISAGDDSPEALGESLQCGTNCGSCLPELKRMLAS